MQTPSYTVTVPSHKTPGVYYQLSVYPDGDTRCTCPDAVYRKRQCKHGRQYVVGMMPTVPVGTRAAAIAAANDAAADAAEVSRIIRGW